MNDRLEKLCFLPPPVNTPWTGPPHDDPIDHVRRRDGGLIDIPSPLFWFDPPWHHVSAHVADQIAMAVAELGIHVTALRSDLSDLDEEPEFCTPIELDETTDELPSGSTDVRFLPRVLPYRVERYGFHPEDLVGPQIIDVRLSIARDQLGHFGYSPARIERWESTPADQPLAGGGWVPAGSFFPDVPSVEELNSKLMQLRELAPQAAIFVSLNSHRLTQELPSLLKAEPDGVILRLDDVSLSGMQLARITSLARKVMNDANHQDIPLWVVPGEITADDAAKLVALGASAVAIDDWCSEIIASASQANTSTLSVAGFNPSGVDNAVVQHAIEEKLLAKVDRVKGLCSSMNAVPANQRLACLSGSWARALRIPTIAVEDA